MTHGEVVSEGKVTGEEIKTGSKGLLPATVTKLQAWETGAFYKEVKSAFSGCLSLAAAGSYDG